MPWPNCRDDPAWTAPRRCPRQWLLPPSLLGRHVSVRAGTHSAFLRSGPSILRRHRAATLPQPCWPIAGRPTRIPPPPLHCRKAQPHCMSTRIVRDQAFDDFFDRTLTVSTAVNARRSMEFPNVTFCNKNTVKCTCDLWCVQNGPAAACLLRDGNACRCDPACVCLCHLSAWPCVRACTAVSAGTTRICSRRYQICYSSSAAHFGSCI